MIEFAKPLLFAALAWWLSTGVVLWLIGRPATTFKWTAWGAGFLMAFATIALLHLRGDTSVAAAYGGFVSGLMLWAWHEVMFLLGFVSGPRKAECPPDLALWDRFKVSAATIIHHEVAIAVHAMIIAALSFGAANKIALWTFLLLWGMRLSAKFVVFFGAPNLSESFLPGHLSYLTSYFSKRSGGAFFLGAIAIVTSVAAVLVWLAIEAPVGSFEAVGWILLGSLAVLAVIEHWALVLPLPDAALWRWAIQGTETVNGKKTTKQSHRAGANHQDYQV